MKIVVLNHADLRLEFLNVPDHMLNDNAEGFLAEHGYSLDNISWFAAPIDYLPVIFHDYGICKMNGEEMDCQRRARLKDFSIHASVEELKGREQEELAEALKIYGEKVDDGFEYHFEGECPIVAAYSYDEPCDVVVLAARVDKEGYITLIVDEKENRGYEHEIEPDEVFAGHLDFITTQIGR